MVLKIAILSNIVGIIFILLGSLLNNNVAEKLRELLFYKAVRIEQDDIVSIKRAASASLLFLSSIYYKGRRMSFVRLLLITLALNISILSGFNIDELNKLAFSGNDFKTKHLVVLYLVIIVFMVFMTLVVEYISLKATFYFLRRAEAFGLFRWVLIDILFLVLVIYLLPLVVGHYPKEKSLMMEILPYLVVGVLDLLQWILLEEVKMMMMLWSLRHVEILMLRLHRLQRDPIQCLVCLDP